MGVYIKGMEMPKNCDSCTFSRRSIHNIDWCVLTEKDLPCDCPLFAVPPHGDLIDMDNLRKTMFIGEQCLYLWDEIEDAIDYAPTIIPAEEGE